MDSPTSSRFVSIRVAREVVWDDNTGKGPLRDAVKNRRDNKDRSSGGSGYAVFEEWMRRRTDDEPTGKENT